MPFWKMELWCVLHYFIFLTALLLKINVPQLNCSFSNLKLFAAYTFFCVLKQRILISSFFNIWSKYVDICSHSSCPFLNNYPNIINTFHLSNLIILTVVIMNIKYIYLSPQVLCQAGSLSQIVKKAYVMSKNNGTNDCYYGYHGNNVLFREKRLKT